MRYEFHPEALEEYDEAGHYYAGQQPGLDLRFIVCVEEAIELILEDPCRWRSFDEDARRCLTRVFPCRILYTDEPDYVLIVAARARIPEAPNRLLSSWCPGLLK